MKQFNSTQTDHLISFLGPERFSTGEPNRKLHLHDISPHQGQLPAAIAWPETTEETVRILTYAYEENIPVTPWGAGTRWTPTRSSASANTCKRNTDQDMT